MRAVKLLIIIVIIAVAALGAYLLGVSNATWQHTPLVIPTMSPKPSVTPTPVAKGNPASIYCTQVGGTLTIQKDGAGNEYGLCTFLDNRACEEWALYKGDCPVGGMKTTGYFTDAQKYCAWLGGTTTTMPNAKCTFNDGSVCPNDALFAGTCHKGNK